MFYLARGRRRVRQVAADSASSYDGPGPRCGRRGHGRYILSAFPRDACRHPHHSSTHIRHATRHESLSSSVSVPLAGMPDAWALVRLVMLFFRLTSDIAGWRVAYWGADAAASWRARASQLCSSGSGSAARVLWPDPRPSPHPDARYKDRQKTHIRRPEPGASPKAGNGVARPEAEGTDTIGHCRLADCRRRAASPNTGRPARTPQSERLSSLLVGRARGAVTGRLGALWQTMGQRSRDRGQICDTRVRFHFDAAPGRRC